MKTKIKLIVIGLLATGIVLISNPLQLSASDSDAKEEAKNKKPQTEERKLDYNRDNYPRAKAQAEINKELAAYSNATSILKAEGAGQIYFYDANLSRIRLINSPQTFESWNFNPGNVLELPSLAAYVLGTQLPNSPQLVKGVSDETYLLDGTTLRFVPDTTVYNNYGFQSSQTRQLTDLLLSDYIDPIFGLPTSPAAQLEKLAAGPTVWLYLPSAGNYRYAIRDTSTFNNWHFNWADVQTVPGLSGVDGGVYLPERPILIKDWCEDKIYMAIPETFQVAIAADLYHIGDPAEFNNWLFNWGAVHTVDYGTRSDYFSLGSLENTPNLVTVDGGANVYLLNDDLMYAYLIPNPTTFNNWRFDWSTVHNITGAAFSAYIYDNDMPLPSTPYLFREEGSPTVFMAQAEQDSISEAYKVSNPTQFNNWRFDWNAVHIVPGHILYASYVTGYDLPSPIL